MMLVAVLVMPNSPSMMVMLVAHVFPLYLVVSEVVLSEVVLEVLSLSVLPLLDSPLLLSPLLLESPLLLSPLLLEEDVSFFALSL